MIIFSPLSFHSVWKISVSLVISNIFIELKDDLGVERTSKELDDWGKQGVLLLNATLTVRAHSPNSHKDLGWEK